MLAADIYRTFPSKAEGLAELLRKVEGYPDDTIFYFRAWTFGYEEAWVALSVALNAKVCDFLNMMLKWTVDKNKTDTRGSLSDGTV